MRKIQKSAIDVPPGANAEDRIHLFIVTFFRTMENRLFYSNRISKSAMKM